MGGWVSEQGNGTCSNFGYRRCLYIKIRLMSHILEDTLTETKKIINLVPLLTKNIEHTKFNNYLTSDQEITIFPLYSLNFPGKQQLKNSLFAGLFQFLQIHILNPE